MPSDAEILDWLESMGATYICLQNGNAIDIESSTLNLRATLADHMKEMQHAQQAG